MEIVKFTFASELEKWFTDNHLDIVYQPETGSNYLTRVLAIIDDPNGGYVAFIDTTAGA